ncbi:MAG: PEP-utilizing enzyme [Patescibacteria group bacterium]|jgi:phosphohistidine swiveling domain-containing protein
MNKPVFTSNQPSITEWFSAIGNEAEASAFREEDNKKVDRLESLFQEIGLPYERPEAFEAVELTECSPRFADVLAQKGDELCAIRLVPKDSSLPKLRQRGLPLKETYENWYKKQDIEPAKYTAFVCPHADALLWASTFVIGYEGIIGEIVHGGHSQLTHGESKETVYRFSYDWNNWQWSESSVEAEAEVNRTLELLLVKNPDVQHSLKEKLGVEFVKGYLVGYFETTVWPDNKVYFIDFNRVLQKLVSLPLHSDTNDTERWGATAFGGIARGTVRIVTEASLESALFESGDILVCDNTDVRYLPLMQKAGAIITDRGGILSHAAIVARELKKPCIIGTKNGTGKLKEGILVEVDAEKGQVRVL